mmetsp:Transcript_78100/g.114354  ORF Transcript_78100/g.114354 Transcript_78100/m.114354 type:complete len:233 (+) Transcript_78100:270-968(+)
MWDRGKLTKPSHDRQTEWLENSRFRSGDTIGILCDMDKRTLSLYRNGEVIRDQGGHYQEGIRLKIGSAELFPDGFRPVIVLGDRFHRARLSFRPIWVQILQATLPEHAFPTSPEQARLGSPNGRDGDEHDDDAFVKKMMGLNTADCSKEGSKREKKKFGRREHSPTPTQSPAETRPASPGRDVFFSDSSSVLSIYGQDSPKLRSPGRIDSPLAASVAGTRGEKKKRTSRSRL